MLPLTLRQLRFEELVAQSLTRVSFEAQELRREVRAPRAATRFTFRVLYADQPGANADQFSAGMPVSPLERKAQRSYAQ